MEIIKTTVIRETAARGGVRVIFQHAASLTNGWNDIGFFKVRIE
jgi:hypothetical protein